MTNWEHNEGRPPSMKDVQAILRDMIKGDRENPAVLALNIRNQMKARNNGFPKDMFHETLDPVLALNEKQAEAFAGMGYTDFYTRREYPKCLYRRNMDARFAARVDPETGEQIDFSTPEFIESRVVKDEHTHKELLKQKTPKGCGPWVDSVSKIDPIPDGPDEDPAVTIARMEGELTALRAKQQKAA